jgi:hypothetical protein
MTTTRPDKMLETLPQTLPECSALRCHAGHDGAALQSLAWVARFRAQSAHYLGLPWPLASSPGAGPLRPAALSARAAAETASA